MTSVISGSRVPRPYRRTTTSLLSIRRVIHVALDSLQSVLGLPYVLSCGAMIARRRADMSMHTAQGKMPSSKVDRGDKRRGENPRPCCHT